jgi:hypothetical protein
LGSANVVHNISIYVRRELETAMSHQLSVNGNPTFRNDRPYPSQSFQSVVVGADWMDFYGSRLIVSGYLELKFMLPNRDPGVMTMVN